MAFPLKRAITTAAASSSSAICNKFHQSKALAIRFSFSSITTSSESESIIKGKGSGSGNVDGDGEGDPPVIVKGSPQKFKMENPFQLRGPKDVVSVDELKDNSGILVRVTLPGVGKGGFKVWAENNTVFFAGRGDIEYKDEETGRDYGGSLEFNPEFNKVDEVKAEMKNGILRMIIPNVTKEENK